MACLVYSEKGGNSQGMLAVGLVRLDRPSLVESSLQLTAASVGNSSAPDLTEGPLLRFVNEVHAPLLFLAPPRLLAALTPQSLSYEDKEHKNCS